MCSHVTDKDHVCEQVYAQACYYAEFNKRMYHVAVCGKSMYTPFLQRATVKHFCTKQAIATYIMLTTRDILNPHTCYVQRMWYKITRVMCILQYNTI